MSDPKPLPAAGDTFGKWRVVSLYEHEDGAMWAVVKNTRNEAVTHRAPVSDLEALKGSA
jgi:hypothetical protein